MKDDDFFWDNAAEGRLLIQQCVNCGQFRHPPAPMCGHCQSLDTRIIPCSGRARVVGWLPSTHPTKEDVPMRIVARLQLSEGPYMISNLHDLALADIHEGLEVAVFFQETDGKLLPQFRPAPPAQ